MKLVVPTLALAALAAAAGCSKKSDAGGGLPPADDWQAPTPLAAQVEGGGGDPHAGVDMGGGDPHAGLDLGAMGGDPHAGVDMGGMGGDPMGGDPMMAGMAPPDPNRPIDPTKYLKGSIAATKETAGAIKPGAILFLSVKPIDPTTGDVIGGTIAVDRIDVGALPVPFNLTEANLMVDGTKFVGDVVITARIDGDGEARSATPGDVEGSVRARVPADGLSLVLDRIVQ